MPSPQSCSCWGVQSSCSPSSGKAPSYQMKHRQNRLTPHRTQADLAPNSFSDTPQPDPGGLLAPRGDERQGRGGRRFPLPLGVGLEFPCAIDADAFAVGDQSHRNTPSPRIDLIISEVAAKSHEPCVCRQTDSFRKWPGETLTRLRFQRDTTSCCCRSYKWDSVTACHLT